MAAETQDDAGPDLDWMTAQPYEHLGGDPPRRSARSWASPPTSWGPGTFYQITKFKDADAVLRDDKTFSSSINAEHIGQFMGELIVGHGRRGAPQVPQPRRQGVPRVAARTWDETLVRPMIHRLLDDDRAARAGRSRRVGHLEVSDAGHLRHRGRAARGLPRSSRSGPRRSTPARWRPNAVTRRARRWSEYLRAARRGAARGTDRRLPLRPRALRGRRRTPDRRQALRFPAPAPARRAARRRSA